MISTGTAFADPPAGSTLYVDHTNSSCTDSGTGTSAAPYCTIQAAVNAAVAGDTVLVAATGATNTYNEDVNVTTSGTPTAPITILASVPRVGYDPQVEIGANSTQPKQTAAFTLSNVHDIVIRGFYIEGVSTVGISIADSSDITVDENETASNGAGGMPPQTGVSISGNSSNVTVSRDYLRGLTSDVSIGTGVSNATVTTNLMLTPGTSTTAVEVQGATGTAITSNSISAGCTTAVAVTGAASTTIENDDFTGSCTTSPTLPLISVDAASAATAKLDYNIPHQGAADPSLYSWAGTGYATAAALTAATGQGAHDLNVLPGLLSPLSAAIDSADANAPGELSTDYYGNPRVDDPSVANTGTGVGYYDRGAVEAEDPMTVNLGTPSGTVPVDSPLTFTVTVNNPWNLAYTGTVNFGDGSAPVPVHGTTATYTYTTPGSYPINATVVDSAGDRHTSNTYELTVSPVTSFLPDVYTMPEQGDTQVVYVAANSSQFWTIASGTVDFGDGTVVQESGWSWVPGHLYQSPGTYTITVAMTSTTGETATKTLSFSTGGSDFTPYGPTRLLDTRNGTGTGGVIAPVAPQGVVKLQIGGVGSIPTGITAVAMNLTATDTHGSGFITAYADGTGQPDVSNVNYTGGQTVPNAVVVPVGSDGAVDLANLGTSAGNVDMVADVTGYFTLSQASRYIPLTPDRLLDTRHSGGGQAQPNKPISLTIAGADGGDLPSTGVTAVALNVTTTDTHGSGNVTVYPDGESVPTASNLNFTNGQTVANAVIVPVGADGKIDLDVNGTTAGSADLIVDVTAYFVDSPGSLGVYVPMQPTRVVDTRGGAGVAAGATYLIPFPLTNENEDPNWVWGSGIVGNVTVTQTNGTGFIAAYPDQGPVMAPPNISTLNYTPNSTVANMAITRMANGGEENEFGLGFYNGGTTAGNVQLIFDVFGYFQ